MEPYYEHSGVTIYNADALDALRAMPGACVDAVVTDPPYGLGMMGKKWDYDVPSVELWREVLRVLKPGGHLLSFGGTRTYHRMVVNVEDAGFEPRDMLAWIYGSGFPKSHDVSKAIDKMYGAEREILGEGPFSSRRPQERVNANTYGQNEQNAPGNYNSSLITAPATDDAKRWAGWGSALKPAIEPILLARKPLDGTIAQNVLTHGVGGLNVDGCRVVVSPDEVSEDDGRRTETVCHEGYQRPGASMFNTGKPVVRNGPANVNGRWPANLIHDGSEEVTALFPVTSSGGGNGVRSELPNNCMNGQEPSTGSAARFFYTAKASKAERGPDNRHPTVKPISLMRYLCRLITPPGGVVLDPFGGSGTTALSARLEGLRCILCERDEESAATAARRLECEVIETDGNYELKEKREEQLSLFKAA